MARRARWKLFGHILRLPDDVPANIVMAEYFSPTTAATGYRGMTSPNVTPHHTGTGRFAARWIAAEILCRSG